MRCAGEMVSHRLQSFKCWVSRVSRGWGACVVIFLVAELGQAQQPAGPVKVWGFEQDRAGKSPAGFSFARTGHGRVGRWVVLAQKDAPDGSNVLAQADNDDVDFRFPIALVEDAVLQDLRLSVKCKPISGALDQACGVVFRYQDENNYYVARANALERNVRLYHVVGGSRRQIAGWSGPAAPQTWHELRLEARGDHLEVFWDGQMVIDAHDQTFPEAGKVGLWTKADSVTYFDDLRIEPLPS